MKIASSSMLLAGLLLTGCVSVHTAKDPLKSAAKPDEGVVLLSVTVNTGEVAAFQSISLTRDQDPPAKKSGVERSYALNNLLPGLSRDTSLFIGTLPAGDYQFKTLNALGKFLNVSDRQRAMLGSFKVEPGKVTDLGRIVLTAVNFGVVVGRSVMVPVNRPLVEEASPPHVQLYGRPAGGGWNTPRSAEDFAEGYAAAYPQGAGGFSELANGEVVGGTRMGALIARNKDGRWRILGRTGKPEAVLSTVPYETGGNLALGVGELGTLVVVDDKGQTTPLARGNLPFGNYIFVDHAPDYSTWFVGVQRGTGAQLYRSARIDGGDWSLVREDTVEADFWSGARPAWFWRQGNGLGYASAAGKLVSCYDYAAGKWTSSPPPEGRKLIGVAGGLGPAMGVLTGTNAGFAGAFAKTHISKDCGANWIEVKSPYTVKMMPPLVLPSGKILEGGGAFGDKGMYASTDEGRTWQKVTSDVTVFNERLWAMPTAGLIAVSLGQFGFEAVEHSADEGKTWKRELTSLNRRALARPGEDAKPAGTPVEAPAGDKQ